MTPPGACVATRPRCSASFLIGLFVFVAILAPLIAPYDPTAGKIVDRFKPPNSAHLLGTDLQGRDILSRIIWGARSSLWVAVLSVPSGLSLGLVYGAISGFVGGWLDFWLMRVVDIVLSLPGLLLTITIVIFLGPGLTRSPWPSPIENVPVFARILRSSILALKESDFTSGGALDRRDRSADPAPAHAAQRADAGHRRRDARPGHGHRRRRRPRLPRLRPAGPGDAGVGHDAHRYLPLPARPGRPFTALFPGVAIVISVLGFNLLGDGLREALDPRLKR